MVLLLLLLVLQHRLDSLSGRASINRCVCRWPSVSEGSNALGIGLERPRIGAAAAAAAAATGELFGARGGGRLTDGTNEENRSAGRRVLEWSGAQIGSDELSDRPHQLSE